MKSGEDKLCPRVKKIIRMIRDEQYGNLLDIGCSDGGMTAYFAKEHSRLFGIEFDCQRGTAARARHIDILSDDIKEGLPLKWNGQNTEGMFDMVFAGEIIEHVEDTDRFLAEIRRVLAPSGKLVITTPNLLSFENRLRMLCGRYPMYVEYRKGGDGHIQVYTTRVLAAQLRRNGFQIEKIKGSFIPVVYSLLPRMDELLRPVTSILADWFPGLAMHAVIKAKKAPGNP
jgi:2-polyprenyl-3-methyl-5-hydroxy-6-metoxy-1,4-benzoquinol methylase